MNRSQLDRREFLKLAALAPLAAWGATRRPPAGGLLPRPAGARQAAGPQTPNILILVFDALTASNMSLYGYARQTTPNLDRLAERAVVYQRHFSSGSFTSPGTASLLTGVYPWTHRALHMRSEILERYAGQNLFALLPAEYRTFAFTQNPLAYVLLNQFRSRIQNLEPMGELADFDSIFSDRLFNNDFYIASEAEMLQYKEEFKLPGSLLLSLLEKLRLVRGNRQALAQYQEEYPRGLIMCRPANPGPQCFRLESAIDWTLAQAAAEPGRPFAGYVHFYPPHAPYNPAAEFSRMFSDDFLPPEKPTFIEAQDQPDVNMRRPRRQYDQSIAHVDAEFARLFDGLQKAGVLENTLVILTSDHGELMERGILGHFTSALYRPLTHIPLLVFPPQQAARQDVHLPTSAVDLLPSLLALSGASLPDGLEGQPLPEFGLANPDPSRSVYTVEAKRNPKAAPLTHASLALVRWPYELVRYTGYPDFDDFEEVYDLENDPEELSNLATPGSPLLKSLQDELDEKLHSVGAV